ncbi:MAG TPA: peptide chain release factor N(5)-glutamine methyltransferase [bacterium]|nr:peptide chain release factor N(5)-glutamine methyltransferase [bacterium]
MTTRDAYLQGREHLQAAGVHEPAIEAEMLLRFVLRIDRAQLYTHWDGALPQAAWEQYRARLDERAGGRPVHYIVGEREFMGLLFAIDERVLIPRPDTELLVEHVVAWIRNHGGSRVVDVGTGSGCIAVSLARVLPDVTVYAADLSSDALDVARANAARHGVSERIRFLQGDLLAPLPPDLAGRIDAVASNPPYVPRDQAFLLAREITDFEPEQAIFVPGDGTEMHRRLIEMAPRWLRPGGLLAMEVGAGQAPTVGDAVENAGGFDHVALLPDPVGIERVVSATLR